MHAIVTIYWQSHVNQEFSLVKFKKKSAYDGKRAFCSFISIQLNNSIISMDT